MARGRHNKRGGGSRFAAQSAEEIEQRNARLEELDEKRAKRREEAAEEEAKGAAGTDAEAVGERVANMNIGASSTTSTEQGETRKQREERQKEEARAAYRKKHEAGLTEEYRRDMEKLAEVRARREAAAAKAKMEEEAVTAEEEERKKKAAAANAEAKADEKKKKKKSGPPKLSSIEIKKMKPTQMKEALKERDLDIQGNKKQLQDRLLKYEAAR